MGEKGRGEKKGKEKGKGKEKKGKKRAKGKRNKGEKCKENHVDLRRKKIGETKGKKRTKNKQNKHFACKLQIWLLGTEISVSSETTSFKASKSHARVLPF